MQETQVRSLRWEDALEKGMATHSSIVALENPMDRGAWWATVHHGVPRVRLTHTHTHTHTHTTILDVKMEMNTHPGEVRSVCRRYISYVLSRKSYISPIVPSQTAESGSLCL